MIDLVTEIMLLRKELDKAIDREEELGVKMAEAEQAYNVKASQTILLMKEQGETITYINSYIKGDPEIAQLRKEYHIAEVLYKAATEKVNATKLHLRLLDSQAGREWSVRGDGDTVDDLTFLE